VTEKVQDKAYRIFIPRKSDCKKGMFI